MDNPENIYDVAIIGGGLAGLTLSIQCAGAGYKTVLFEKEIYPFHKVCGEYISLESYPFLENMGLTLQEFNVPIIKKLQLTDVAGKLYEFNLDLGGFGISRYKLDSALYEIAKKKGVYVLTGVKVVDVNFENNVFTIYTGNRNFISKITAGAFGKRSNLDIKWKRDFVTQKPDKLNNYIGVKYHIQYPFPKENIALHNFHNGYCGISNIEENKCCFCYLTTAGNLKENNNSVAQMEKNVLWKNPLLKKIFCNAQFIYNEPLVISQISFSEKKQVENHVLMIGDSAGLITPLCGNGMSMAMHAAKLAFENIQAFIEQQTGRQQMEQRYAKQWQQHFNKRLFIGRLVQRLFGNNTITSVFLKLMHKMPWLADKLIRSTHGKPF
ncbi:MAG TPA: NAD(P)/FAD-dependent oxidoreductase [Chitinophagaceae bacterium]|jgi:flavin-dependent dehydrogenase